MRGKIIKGIAGFYYVHTPEDLLYECKAKGIFRKEKQKPLVGDDVEIEVLDQQELTGNIVELLPRKNQLIRPAVANIDQAMVMFAAKDPEPNFPLLDRFLVAMTRRKIPAVIVFNKADLADQEIISALQERYAGSGYPVIMASASEKMGLKELQDILSGKTTTMAGPSGVGKSSWINLLQDLVEMETGDISHKIARGKHTTRHTQLIYMKGDTYIMDTPGFTSLYTEDLQPEELSGYFAEFSPYEEECRFLGCSHTHEPDCGVKKALEQGLISSGRYENYAAMYQELKEMKRY